jgi:transglutaminase-like putative cysteine protease
VGEGFMKTQFDDISRYLEASEIIDFDNTEVAAVAQKIFSHSQNEIDFAKNAFEFVRDKISHTGDIGASIVTFTASEVLREKHGVCYAKSHLLAAILRFGKIPAGFCYQKLILDDETHPQIALHGLNAVFLRGKWSRIDARGNKSGVNAQFSLDEEKLAFPIRAEKGEEDIPIIFAAPDKSIFLALSQNKTIKELWFNLPTQLHETELKND